MRPPTPTSASHPGFSLIELLVVIAVLAILAAVVAPSLGVMGGKSLNSSIETVAGSLELARQQALTRRTYVYLGFIKKPANTSGNTSGVPLVQIGTLLSNDGTAETTQANLRPASKLQTLPGLILANTSELSQPVHALITAQPAVTEGILSSTAKLLYSPGVELQNVITFSPDGSVFLGVPGSSANAAATGFTEIIDIGLRQAKSDSPPPTAADACLYLYGNNGRTQVIRPN